MNKISNHSVFATVLQDFFCEYLINQKNVSIRTISSYRDTFKLLLLFAEKTKGKHPVRLTFEDIDCQLILNFLLYLEKERKNKIRSRNARLAAIRSFIKYSSLRIPSLMQHFDSIMTIPLKRCEKVLISCLSRKEVMAIINAPDITTWSGKRDRTMFSALYNTGARASEIISIKIKDVDITHSRCVTLHGKGRKERILPIWKDTAKQINEWLGFINTYPDDPLFPNKKNEHLTRSGLDFRLKTAAKSASKSCKSLIDKTISPHVIRHTTAMHLLEAGVEITVIALWLGHENLETTHMYMEASLEMKVNAIQKVKESQHEPFIYKPSDKLLDFLEKL